MRPGKIRRWRYLSKHGIVVIVFSCLLSGGWIAAQDPAAIPSAFRAVAIPLPAWQLDSVKAGDYVDVVLAYARPLPQKSDSEGVSFSTVTIPVAITILQDVRVFRVLGPDKQSGMGGVELAVVPRDGQFLAWGLAWGKVTLAIRGAGDHEKLPYTESNVQPRLSR